MGIPKLPPNVNLVAEVQLMQNNRKMRVYDLEKLIEIIATFVIRFAKIVNHIHYVGIMCIETGKDYVYYVTYRLMTEHYPKNAKEVILVEDYRKFTDSFEVMDYLVFVFGKHRNKPIKIDPFDGERERKRERDEDAASNEE